MGVFKYKRKDGTSSWYYDFMYNGVRYRNLGGTTKTQALRVLEKKRTEVINNDFGLVKKISNPKIELFANTYLGRRKHLRFHKRDALSVKNLLKVFTGKNLNSITPANIEDFICRRVNEGVSNASINRELACLKRMFSLANKWDEARHNPVKEINFLEEPPGRTRFLSENEARDLLSVASNHIKPIITTALNTGMRLGEVLSLKWSQVHLENVIDPIVELTSTKNNRKRFIFLNDNMISLFNNQPRISDFIFLSTGGKPLKSVRKPFQRALKMAGISDFRFHDLRHTFASHYVMNGGDLMSLKETLGHSSLKMVERYSHLTSAYKRRILNRLPNEFSVCQIFAKNQNKEDSYENNKAS